MSNQVTTLPTAQLENVLNVRHRLQLLSVWEEEFKKEDALLLQRIHLLDENRPVQRQQILQILRLRKALISGRIKDPIDISPELIIEKGGFKPVRGELVNQFAKLTQSERHQWMDNLIFFMTLDLKELLQKTQAVSSYRVLGQQRNFLLGGRSGMGKTTFLDWLTSTRLAVVEPGRNHVPVVAIDAPVNNRTAKPLFQRILLGFGLTFGKSDPDEELLERIIAYAVKCGLEMLIIDEIEHITSDEIRCRVKELSNVLRPISVPIICASVNPERWIEGDEEIAGRWNDKFALTPYTLPDEDKGERSSKLIELLSLLELILPFTQPSHLFEMKVGKDTGPAQVIFNHTGGILRDIMLLIRQASKVAIEQDMSCLTIQLLNQTWGDIQKKAVGR
jgi:hypothetical protein